MLSTRAKIHIARALSKLICGLRRLLGLGLKVQVSRGGVNWSLDLKEGIDLAIYVLGGFELDTLKLYTRLLNSGDVVLDIGANIGAHTLPFALLVGDTGKVISFEPTRYAFLKQQQNIALNPLLSERIKSLQILLVSEPERPLVDAIYSSWPLESTNGLEKKHLGRLMATNGASQDTLDSVISGLALMRIDFIKLDVDGNELDVLLGAEQVIKHFKPRIIVELAPYVYDRDPQQFDQLINFFLERGYILIDGASKQSLPVDPGMIRKLIPRNGSINALAIPNNLISK